jgi:hypothetical protein
MTQVVNIFERAVVARTRLLPPLQGGREATLARLMRQRNIMMLLFRGVSRLLLLLTC